MQVEHKTEKGTISFFLPPSGADRFKYFNDEKPYLSYFIGSKTFREYFPNGTVLIGLTSEVTEEQAKMMVPELWSGYKDLTVEDDGTVGNYNRFVCATALEAFKRLANHLRIYEFNPINFDYKSDNVEWSFIQKRVGPWIVLFKPNEK